MTYREYMLEHEEENLGWCMPYQSKDGEYTILIYDGIAEAAITPERICYRWNGKLTDELIETIETIAKAVNAEYDLYHGWSDLHIALEAMREIGCAQCPFREDCEAMGEEIEG